MDDPLTRTGLGDLSFEGLRDTRLPCIVWHMSETQNAEWIIEWDLGEYAGFRSEDEARAYQRANRMTGSSVTRVA